MASLRAALCLEHSIDIIVTLKRLHQLRTSNSDLTEISSLPPYRTITMHRFELWLTRRSFFKGCTINPNRLSLKLYYRLKQSAT